MISVKEDAIKALQEMRACAASWEFEVRILGNVRAGDVTQALDVALEMLRKPDVAPILELARKYLSNMTCDSCLEHPVNGCTAPVHRRPCQSCAEWKSAHDALSAF